jgi:hypothetical protein
MPSVSNVGRKGHFAGMVRVRIRDECDIVKREALIHARGIRRKIIYAMHKIWDIMKKEQYYLT